MTDRPSLDDMTSDQLDQLYAELDRAETENAELRDALAHCPEREPRQRAEETVTRVTGLYEQWVKAGPPPLGVPLARWWDRRIVELHGAIHTPANNPPKEQP